MTSASHPLPRCGGRRVGVGAGLGLLIFGTTFLLLVAGGGVNGLTCERQEEHNNIKSEVQTCSDKEKCCSYEFYKKNKPLLKCTSVCDKELRCVKYKPEDPKDEDIRCFCATDNCNKDPNYWKGKKDELYNKFHGLTEDSPSSTTKPSRNNAAIISGLLVVVASLGSLSHFITALI